MSNLSNPNSWKDNPSYQKHKDHPDVKKAVDTFHAARSRSAESAAITAIHNAVRRAHRSTVKEENEQLAESHIGAAKKAAEHAHAQGWDLTKAHNHIYDEVMAHNNGDTRSLARVKCNRAMDSGERHYAKLQHPKSKIHGTGGKRLSYHEPKEENDMSSDGLKQIVESAKKGQLHPKHIHVHGQLGKYRIHSIGSQVERRIKKGMVVSSGDLDDFRQFGYKVKETKKP